MNALLKLKFSGRFVGRIGFRLSILAVLSFWLYSCSQPPMSPDVSLPTETPVVSSAAPSQTPVSWQSAAYPAPETNSPAAHDTVPPSSPTEPEPKRFPVSRASATPFPTPESATATPLPRLEPDFAGLVLGDQSGLWQVQSDGRLELIFAEYWAALSPDERMALYEYENDIYLANLDSGASTNLTGSQGRFECCPSWWPARPGQILFGSSEDLEGGYIVRYLSAIQIDGSDYRVLDPEEPANGPVTGSPDGRWLAYGYSKLFDWDNGLTETLDLSNFGLEAGQFSLFSMAWSPNGRQLAGNISWQQDDRTHFATVILDLEAHTSTIVHPFAPVGSDGPYPPPIWSPDGNWLAIDAFAKDPAANGVWVFPAGGQPEQAFQLQPSAGLIVGKGIVWSPDSKWLMVRGYETPLLAYRAGEWQAQEILAGDDFKLVTWK